MDVHIALDHPLTTIRVLGATVQFQPMVVQVVLSMGRMENGTFVPSTFEPTMNLTDEDARRALEGMGNVGQIVAEKFGGSVLREE